MSRDDGNAGQDPILTPLSIPSVVHFPTPVYHHDRFDASTHSLFSG